MPSPSVLKSRQTKYWSYAGTYIVVILAVLVAVNFLANRYDKSWDSTANKQFSLAEQTIKYVKGLKNDVKVTYFGGTETFPNARDLLDRYSSLSPKFHVDYVDPERKPSVAKQAGFRPDAPIMIDSGARKEAAKSLSEEEITGALIRSLKTGARTVCVLNAGGEHSLEAEGSGSYSFMKQLLERDNYTVKTVSLQPPALDASKPVAVGQTAPPETGTAEIPKECTVLVVGGPQLDYPAPTVAALKNFVENGGRELLMFDTPLEIGKDTPAAANVEMMKVLEGWGVTMNNDLVLDFSGIGQFLRLDHEVPLILTYEAHPITQPLNRVPTAYPLVRSIDVKSGDKTTVSKLFGTGEESVAVSKVGPGGQVDPKSGKKGPLTLGVAGTYNGATPGRFVVVGTSMWAQNSLLGSRQIGNRDMLANMINWLSSDEDLISIRPKNPEDRPLTLTPAGLRTIFWLSFVMFPLGVVAVGLATWWKRR